MLLLSICAVGVLGGTHPWSRPGCWPLWVPVLPRPGDEEEVEAGLPEGLGWAVQRGGDGRLDRQSGLRPHRLRRGESWEKRRLQWHARRSAVFGMTITRTGNRDQPVGRSLVELVLPLVTWKQSVCPQGFTAGVNCSSCHEANTTLRLNPTTTCTLHSTLPEVLR